MVFADIIKDLEMERLSWIIEALNSMTSAFIKDTQKNDTKQKRKNVALKAEIGVMPSTSPEVSLAKKLEEART